MTSGIDSILLAVSSSWMLALVAKAASIAAIGLVCARVAARKRAAFRHTVLAATFGVLLALPVVSLLAPPLAITVQQAPAPLASHTLPAALLPFPAATHAPKSGWSMSTLFAAIWAAGTIVFLIPAAAGVWQLHRIRRSSRPWQAGQAEANALSTRRVHVLLSGAIPGPMTCGVFQPAIVLPADAAQWESDDLLRALVHELEHVHRCDWAVHCIARTVCAVYWFLPLVWLAWRRLELEAERSCDDAVLDRSDPSAYADQLVSVARRLSAARRPFLAMATRADLSSRVRAVLDTRQPRGVAGARCVTFALLVATAVVLTLSPLHVIAAPQSTAPVAQIRTEARLVAVQTKVTYPNGDTVRGLTAADFEVAEDGVAQQVRIFEFQPETETYLLAYYPANARDDGKFRKIDVHVKTATTAKVEHREGYLSTFPRPEPATAQRAAATPPPYDRPPVIILKKDPEYSEAARKAKYQGMVLIAAEIDEAGQPTNLHVVRSLGLGLDEKALEAVRQWRFKPATKDGKPVTAPLMLEVSFRLM
jgi:TonB family protein